MSNETFWPSARVRIPAASTAETWTNTSLPPPSGEMKPKPLVVLKNFTVPMVMIVPWHRFPPVRHAQAVREDADQTRKFRLSRPGAHLRRVGFYRCASSDGRRRGGTNSASGVNLQWT